MSKQIRRTFDGRTPLSYAAERGHEAVVKLRAERDDVEGGIKGQRWSHTTVVGCRGGAQSGREAAKAGNILRSSIIEISIFLNPPPLAFFWLRRRRSEN